MEIQSDSDSWDPQPQINLNKNTQKNKPTLFNKILINFNDDQINQNINKLCEKPILQQEIKDFQNDQFQFGQHQTKQQPDTQLFGKKPSKKQMHQENQIIEKQAMYDALQDDQNNYWIKKNIGKGKDQKRPLTCPNCFTQLCYNYIPLVTQDDQKGYQTEFPHNIQICANKIIRNRASSQKINCNNVQESLKKANQESSIKILQDIGQMLKQRYEEINVKIICKCNQCDHEVGYFDVNRQRYVIFNVI